MSKVKKRSTWKGLLLPRWRTNPKLYTYSILFTTDSHEITRTELESSKNIPFPTAHPRIGHKSENPSPEHTGSRRGLASPQTSFGVRLSRIQKWMRDKRTPKDVCGEASRGSSRGHNPPQRVFGTACDCLHELLVVTLWNVEWCTRGIRSSLWTYRFWRCAGKIRILPL